MRKEKRMSEEDFIKNLSGINNGNDLDQTMLSNIYNRVKKSEFKANDDHINQVKDLQSNASQKDIKLFLGFSNWAKNNRKK